MSDQLALEAGPRKARPRLLVVGTALVGVAVMAAFWAMLAIYVQMRHDSGGVTSTWVPSDVTFRNAQLVFVVFTAVISSITVQWATSSNRIGDAVNTRIAVGVTLLFGALHLNMLLYSWDALGSGIGNIWTNLVYPITGASFALTSAAMVFLIVMAIKVFGGQIGVRNPGLAAAAVFWHVQVAVFFIVFITIYAVK